MELLADIIVIGAGHAGCEAALISARMGCLVTMITMQSDKIAEMSCNPSIGGVGKGQLVREIDALGGEMGKNADYTGIQFKRLNTRKGSAVQSSRCQSDKNAYARRMRQTVKDHRLVTVYEAEVKSLVVENGRVIGVECVDPLGLVSLVMGQRVVLTTGTFMKAVMHCGFEESQGGRFGEKSSSALSGSLKGLGLRLMRLKTGTPARLKRDTIDFSQLSEQKGDELPKRFSFSNTKVLLPQVSCYLGYTHSSTHAVIRRNLALSPLYSGKIAGIGPRYCPSIEDKVVKFPQKSAHHIFFEPESLGSDWIYPNGISTSLPAEVQDEFIRTLPGCSQATVLRYGYAVEYDCVDPMQLERSLECKTVKGLFLAGQVNGTSGYEEAAAQGLYAGINAALSAQCRPSLLLDRSEAYIAVMIDDLVTKGITEPYRMFTSRAEYRLSLREDNADLRLRPYALALGLVSDEDRLLFTDRLRELTVAREYISSYWLKPSAESLTASDSLGLSSVTECQTLRSVLKRPEYGIDEIEKVWGISCGFSASIKETIEIESKYEGYIDIQRAEIDRLSRLNSQIIPETIDYSNLVGLSRELVEKLDRVRPKSIGEAARISGMTPAGMVILVSRLKSQGVRVNGP